jgi:hypothetical protein
MSRQFRIRVYGKQRKDIDPALLAQIVILFGRHLHQQKNRKPQIAGHRKVGQSFSISAPPAHRSLTISPSEHKMARTPEGDGAPGNAGGD